MQSSGPAILYDSQIPDDRKTARHIDYHTMYINQILTYLVWPVFILVSWFIIRAAVILYEKKFAEAEKPPE